MEVTINGKNYVLKYTRKSICDTEDAFGISMINREEPKTFKEMITLIKALLYGALIANQKDLKVEDMDDVYDEFISEDGFEPEDLIEGLIELVTQAMTPAGGKRKKKFKKSK